MFEDSLIESGGRRKGKRGATTILSFVLQICLLGVLVLIPLIYTEALPKQQLMTFLVAPPPPPPPPPPAAAPVRVVQPVSGGVVGGVPGGVPGGSMGGVIGGIIGATASTGAVPKAVTPQRVRVSQGVSQGLLIHEVRPAYPPLARQARIQGAVVLQAVIGKDGAIQNLHVVSGHPMLTTSAIDAVKQWRYKPYFLNGEPVEVDTQITVNFTLSGG
jgi:protein TonB